MHIRSIFLTLAILLALVLPAQAKLTLGVVPGANQLLQSEKQARALGSLMATRLGEKVKVRTFKSEADLHDWLVRYGTVDLAVFSRDYYQSQPVWEFQLLANYLRIDPSGPVDPDPVVARHGLSPQKIRSIQNVLLTLESDAEGNRLLENFQIKRFVAPGARLDLEALDFPVQPEPPPVVKPQAPRESPAPAPPTLPAPSPPRVAKPAPPLQQPLQQPPPLKKPVATEQLSFAVKQLAEGVYAALAKPGSTATSNCFFVIGEEFVVAGGSHMTREVASDLATAVRSVTDKPIRQFILTHHHKGFSHIDFDFPAGQSVIMSWQTWQSLDSEVRDIGYPALFFSEGLTLKLGKRTVILTNMDKGHTDGDTLIFVPEAGVLFASDLLYVNSVGYMGEGYMQEWVLALEFMERLGAKQIIPGFGPVCTTSEISHFKNYFKSFLTAVIARIEAGDSLEQAQRAISLPEYRGYAGYDQLLKQNIARAYQDLKDNLLGQPD